MSSLIFESLEIKGFRVFEHLQIKRLGRINLIVGKNNVGKSSLLEALAIYARQGLPQAIWELLESRDEIQPQAGKRGEEAAEEIEEALAIRHLFHGRANIGPQQSPILIGEIDSIESRLSITAGWYVLEANQNGRRQLYPLEVADYDKVDNPIVGIALQKGTQEEVIHRFTRTLVRRSLLLKSSEQRGIKSLFIPANGLTERQISTLWDNIALTNLENEVIQMLRLVTKEVERVNLIGHGKNRPLPIVKIFGSDEPVPLRSLGEGLNRMFGIALALVNATNGLLLIDEVVNGLHYSVQVGLWRVIFAIAHRLNVQVFATSHSNDCIFAFQEAASDTSSESESESESEAGLLIRLENRQGQIVPILFDEQRLAIATQQEIEVR